jgi:hypothetical protein
MITKDKNKRNCDDDGDKGSDSKKPRTEKKGPKPVDTGNGIALKIGISDSLLETRAQRDKCKCCRSQEHRRIFCKNPIEFSFNSKKNKKSKMETSVMEVVTSSSKIDPSSLTN